MATSGSASESTKLVAPSSPLSSAPAQPPAVTSPQVNAVTSQEAGAGATVPSPAPADTPAEDHATAVPALTEGQGRGGFAIAFENVMRSLGKDAAIKFRRAMQLSMMCMAVEAERALTDVDAQRLEDATAMFVELLSAVPEGNQQGMGFAELLLGYGQALLVYVRKTGAAANVLGDAVEKKEDEGGEEDIEDEDEDYEELAWTQLETARVLMEKVGKGEGGEENGQRLGAVHMALGDLLLEGDSWDGAGREFETAARLLKGRFKAEALYKRYLSLRREAAREALVALKESIAVFEGEKQDEHAKRTLAEMKEDLKGFESAVMGAVKRVKEEEERRGKRGKSGDEGSGSGDGAGRVVVVEPRKRAKKE